MAERKIRAEVNGLPKLGQSIILPPAQPKRAAHRPMRGGVAIVGNEALACCCESQIALDIAIRPMLEGVLPMGERQAGMGAGKCRIEPQRHLEEILGEVIVRSSEPIHVPE